MSMERRTREGVRPLPLLQWSVQDVVVWLNSLKLSIDYSSLFKEYHIDGQFLTKVTPNFIDEKLHITNTADRSILLRSISDLRLHQLSTTLPRLPVNEYDNTALLSPPPSGNDTTRTARGGAHGKSKSFDELLNEQCHLSTPPHNAPPPAPPVATSRFVKSSTPVPHSQIVSSHLLDILKEENSNLKKELDYYYQRVCRLQKFEQDLERLQEAHRLLEASTARKEKLELVMRQKLEAELKQLREYTAQHEVQIASVRRNASLKMAKPDDIIKKEIARKDSIIAKLIKQNQDGVIARERLEKDLHDMRTASTAATPAVTGPATDEGECKEAVSLSKGTTESNKIMTSYSESVAALTSILNGMTSSHGKQSQLEFKLRKQLENKIKELKEERGGERGMAGSGDKEEKDIIIATLEADKAKLEHKVLELVAERQLLEDSITIPKNAVINRLERQLQEKESELNALKEQKAFYAKRLESTEESLEESKTKISSLERTLGNRDILIESLQSLLEPVEDNSSSPSHDSTLSSSPRKISLDTLTERGGEGGAKNAVPLRKISSPVFSTTNHEEECHRHSNSNGYGCPSLPTYDEHMLGKLGPIQYQAHPSVPPPPSITHSLQGGGGGGAFTHQLLLGQPVVASCSGSKSFPNTPEIHRRGGGGGGGGSGGRYYSKPAFISAPSSHQNSPRPHHKPRPFCKSLTPPPHRLPNLSFATSQVGVAQRHMIKGYSPETVDASDNSSVDSLLSPSSPNNHKHTNSAPNKKNVPLIHYIIGEGGRSQDSGVLVELCGHV